MTVLLIAVVAGALAGGLAYLGVLGARRFWGVQIRQLWTAVAASVVALVVATGVVTALSPARLFGGEQIAAADVLPFMRLIKTREPRLYERIETSVIRDQEDGMSGADVRANARSLVMSYVADKMAFLPDDLTYELFATTRDQLAYLAEQKDYTTCADLALGRAKGDLVTKLSKELAERADNNATRVISTERNDAAPRMAAEEFTQLANRAFGEATQTTGIPPEELDNLLAGSGEPAKTCKLMKAFFDAILAQPIATAAAALRTLASGERTATP